MGTNGVTGKPAFVKNVFSRIRFWAVCSTRLDGRTGLMSAAALLRVLVAAAPAQLPRLDMIQVSGTPLLTSLAVTSVALIVFGVAPSLLIARGDVATTLREVLHGARVEVERHVELPPDASGKFRTVIARAEAAP